MERKKTEDGLQNRKAAKIAYSFVMADLLHYGHIRLLKTAKENADYHVCGLISDEACHLWQGINICNFQERKAVLESLDCVDEVMKQDTLDPTDNITAIKKRHPEAEIVIVHGDDWKSLPGIEYLESIGCRIIQPEYYAKLSRETIIRKFKESVPYHPLIHEYFTGHFRIGNIIQFNPFVANALVSTKANTLRNFQPLLKTCRIEELFVCTVEDFKEHKDEIVKSIQRQFAGGKLIVRSSSVNEDRYNISNAGCYHSVGDVSLEDGRAIEDTIVSVIASYEATGDTDPANQILVQSQTTDIKKSGVVFTRNLQNNTPYYLINYDSETGKTDTVTGGETSKSIWLYRKEETSGYPPEWQGLFASIKEIEGLLPGMILDIEFAEKNDGTIVIFQIRPLAANVRYAEHSDEDFDRLLEKNISKYKALSGEDSEGKPFLSDMAFWNPSEIIGDNPHPLDYSIYREIITRKAWNEGLTPLRYSPVRHELMVKFGNKPYINLDHAFHALIPASVDKKLRDKLKAHYRASLGRDLTAHDKIEFETTINCYDLDTEEKLRRLLESGFTEKETGMLSAALRDLTLSAISGYRKRLEEDLKDLNALSSKREAILGTASRRRSAPELIGCSLRLLSDVERHGTPQFTTVAREAFISRSILKSLASRGFFSPAEVDGFMEGITTVASEFNTDFERLVSGGMGKEQFVSKYGHLRAGTYDITSKRFDRMDFESIKTIRPEGLLEKKPAKAFEDAGLKKALAESPFSVIRADDFIFFLRSSIEMREYFKFEFTKSLSLALELLAEAGASIGFKREELAYLELPAIKSFRHYGKGLAAFWRMYIDRMKASYTENSRLILPPVIQGEADFKAVNSWVSRPNFITDRFVEGETANLDEDASADIRGKIVLLKKADPGYDWIFTQDIKALITKYGGAASHMAIRCAEFNIPAAIGCGEQIYNTVSKWNALKLDCRKKKILPIMCAL